MNYTVEQLAEILNNLLNASQTAAVTSPEPISTLDPITEKIKKETDAKVAQKLAIAQKKIEEIALINATFQVILEDYIGAAASEMVVKILDKCRTSSGMNFNQFCAAYSLPGIKNDLKKRNLLIVTSALYRLKVKSYDPSRQATLRSLVKYSSMCDDCGVAAKQLIDRLDIQGIKF
jgi:hypothetical protein